MISIKAPPHGGSIDIGYIGENKAREVLFDLSFLRETYGDGAAQLFHRRAGDATAYPVVAEQSGDTLIWEVSAADTAKRLSKECGEVQLHWLVGDVVAKTVIYRTIVHKSLDVGGEEPPEPVEVWYRKLMDKIENAKVSTMDDDAQLELAITGNLVKPVFSDENTIFTNVDGEIYVL